MDFKFTEEQERFRQEVKDFLKEELPKRSSAPTSDPRERSGWSSTFSKALAQRGWISLPWPKEYGGLGLDHIYQAIFNEEIAYHRAPIGAHRRGIFYIAPILMLHGSEDQKQEFLPRIASGEGYFCQGFSEPNAGSDLASLATTAVADGDSFVINGSKIWTSDAHRADYCFLSARSDADAPKHKGISNFLVDLTTPGITVRPLVNMAGAHSFTQVFFDNVRVPRRYLVGEQNMGWYQSAQLLDFERSSIAVFGGIRRTVEDLANLSRESRWRQRLDSYPGLRHNLAELSIKCEIGRWLSYSIASMQTRQEIPNKEASAAKLFAAELQQRTAAVGMNVIGLYGQLRGGSSMAPLRGAIERLYLSTVASTIGGGTSEIQRNVIATRGLGLPRG